MPESDYEAINTQPSLIFSPLMSRICRAAAAGNFILRSI